MSIKTDEKMQKGSSGLGRAALGWALKSLKFPERKCSRWAEDERRLLSDLQLLTGRVYWKILFAFFYVLFISKFLRVFFRPFFSVRWKHDDDGDGEELKSWGWWGTWLISVASHSFHSLIKIIQIDSSSSLINPLRPVGN